MFLYKPGVTETVPSEQGGGLSHQRPAPVAYPTPAHTWAGSGPAASARQPATSPHLAARMPRLSARAHAGEVSLRSCENTEAAATLSLSPSLQFLILSLGLPPISSMRGFA